MDNNRRGPRSSLQQRLGCMEGLLFSEGHLNRSDLVDQVGVSVEKPSPDLNRCMGFGPDNMVYSKSARTHVRGSWCTQRFLAPAASRHAERSLNLDVLCTATIPPCSTAPTPVRQRINLTDDHHDMRFEVTPEMGCYTEPSTIKAALIALDYGTRDGRAESKVERALRYGAPRRFRLGTDRPASRLRDQQIMVLNCDAVSLVHTSAAP